MKKLLFLFLIASSLIASDTREWTEVTSDGTSSHTSSDTSSTTSSSFSDIDFVNRICEVTQKMFLLQREQFVLQERIHQLRQKLYPRKHIAWNKMLVAHKRRLHIAKGI